jgi:hypothetical protein
MYDDPIEELSVRPPQSPVNAGTPPMCAAPLKGHGYRGIWTIGVILLASFSLMELNNAAPQSPPESRPAAAAADAPKSPAQATAPPSASRQPVITLVPSGDYRAPSHRVLKGMTVPDYNVDGGLRAVNLSMPTVPGTISDRQAWRSIPPTPYSSGKSKKLCSTVRAYAWILTKGKAG